jgi:hypothetical protein
MLNIQTQHKFKYACSPTNFVFKLLLNVKLIYSIQVLGACMLWGNRPFFSSVVGQRKGPSGENFPPVHGIKKCLDVSVNCITVYTVPCLFNPRAYFVCARPNSSVSVQLKVWQLSYVCAAGIARFIIVSFYGIFVFRYSCFNFLRGLTYVSLWTVSAWYHVYSIFCFFWRCFVFQMYCLCKVELFLSLIV